MSVRSSKYWATTDATDISKRDPIAFEDIPSMHPCEMHYRLSHMFKGCISSFESLKKDLETGWFNGWIHLSYDIAGFDMGLRMTIGYHTFRKDGDIKYAWNMDIDVMFDEKAMTGHLSKLYESLLEIDNEVYESHAFYAEPTYGMCQADHILSPERIFGILKEFEVRIIEGWNVHNKQLFIGDAYRYCMDTYREQCSEWGRFYESMAD